MAHNRSWRMRQTAEMSRGVRTTQIVLLLLVLGLATALFIYLLWRPNYPRPFVRAFYVPEYGLLDSQLDYVATDLDRLAACFPGVTSGVDDRGEPLKAFEAIQILSAGMLTPAGLRESLKYASDEQRDIAIFFVAIHGISRDEAGWWLISDRETVNVADFISTLASAPAKTKLILVDAGRVGRNPGNIDETAINEFVWHLNHAVRQLSRESRTWLMCSHALLQNSYVIHAEKQSVFGQAVENALRKVADRKTATSIGQFYDDVLRHCERMTRVVDNTSPLEVRARQTPILMLAGHGAVLEQHRLEFQALLNQPFLRPEQIPPRLDESKQEGVAHRLDKSRSEERGRWLVQLPVASTLGAAAEPLGAVMVRGISPQDSPSSAAAPPSSAAADTTQLKWDDSIEQWQAQIPDVIDRLWKRRDMLQSRAEIFRGNSPIDLAPVAWRETNRLLVALENRHRAGSLTAQDQMEMNRIENFFLALGDAFRTHQEIAVDRNWRDPEQQLARAWNELAQSSLTKPDSTEGIAQEAQEFRQRLAEYRDALYHVRDMAQWYFQLSMLRPNLSSAAVDEILSAVREDLSFMERDLYVVSSENLGEVRRRSLRWLQLKSGVMDAMRQSLRHAAGRSQFEVEQTLIALLDCPLIPYDAGAAANGVNPPPLTRRELRQLWKDSQTTSRLVEEADSGGAWPASFYPLDVGPWQAAQRRLSIFWRLIEGAADRAGMSLPSPPAIAIRPPANETDMDGPGGLLPQFRAWARHVCNAQQQVDQAWSRASSEGQHVRTSQWQWSVACLLPPPLSEGGRVHHRVHATAFHPPPIAPSVRFVQPIVHRLNLDETTRHVFHLQVEGRGAQRVRLEFLEFPQELLELKYQDRTHDPRQPLQLEPLYPGTTSLELQWVPRRRFEASDRARLQTLTVVAHVANGSSSEPLEFQVVMPLPDRLALMVDQAWQGDSASRLVLDSQRPNVVRMRPFANRWTYFDWSLQNDSGRDRTMDVSIFAVPAPPSFRAPPLVGRATTGRDVHQDLVRWAPDQIERGKLRPLWVSPRFVVPKTGSLPLSRAAVSAAGAEGTPGTPADQEIAFEGFQCMLMRLTEYSADQPLAVYDCWLDLHLVTPDELFDYAQVDGPLAQLSRQGEFRLTLATAPAMNWRDGIAIDCRLRSDGQSGNAFRLRNSELTMDGNRTKGSLVAEWVLTGIENAERRPRLWVDVNGVPRAMVYELDPQTAGSEGFVPNRRPILSELGIRNVRFSNGEAEQDALPFRKANTWALPPSARQIVAGLHVDLPHELASQASLYATLRAVRNDGTLGAIEREWVFSTDRHIYWFGKWALGRLGLQAEVKDHTLVWDVSGHQGAFRIDAQVRTGNVEFDQQIETLVMELRLDHDPPSAEIAFASSQLRRTTWLGTRGETVKLRVTARDELTAIDPKSVVLLVNGEASDLPPQSESDGSSWLFELPTKELTRDRYEISARVSDLVGNPRKTDAITLQLSNPPETGASPNTEPVASPRVTLTIKLTWGTGRGLSADSYVTEVKLMQGESVVQSINQRTPVNAISFADVLEGDYKVLVKGVSQPGNNPFSGEATIKVDRNATTHTIRVAR